MTGNLLLAPRRADWAPHTHVVFELDDGRDLRFVDPRRFGLVDVVDPRQGARARRAWQGSAPTPSPRASRPATCGDTPRRRSIAGQGAPARPGRARRGRQHLRVRGAVAGADLAAPHQPSASAPRGRAPSSCAVIRGAAVRHRQRRHHACATSSTLTASPVRTASTCWSTAATVSRARDARAPSGDRSIQGRATYFCPTCQNVDGLSGMARPGPAGWGSVGGEGNQLDLLREQAPR